MIEKFFGYNSDEIQIILTPENKNEEKNFPKKNDENIDMIDLSSEIKTNRIMYYIMLKNIKSILFSEEKKQKIDEIEKKVLEKKQNKTQKIRIFKQYINIILRYWFKFFTLYMSLFSEKKTIDELRYERKKFPSLSSSEDEINFTSNNPKWLHLNRKLSTFPKFSIDCNKYNEFFFIEYFDFLKRFDANSIKPLNLEYETNEFVCMILENLFLEAVILKSSKQFHETYILLSYAFSLIKNFSITEVKSFSFIIFS